MNRPTVLLKNITIILFTLLIAGCITQQTRLRSNVMEYLYPDEGETLVQPATPHLKLPLKVGIAFVPDSNLYRVTSPVSETVKNNLLESVADQFRGLEYVSEIEVIPSAYLTPKGGFQNLNQIQTMFGIDVIALVSYDQVQFTDEDLLSLSYWTIIGAYVVSGEKNSTSTMMDTVVYDIDSQKLLFRAPGTSRVEGRATPVSLSRELREDSITGFNLATKEMTKNLSQQLQLFTERVKDKPDQITISHRAGYSGGGAVSLPTLLVVLLLAGFRRLKKRT